MGPLSGHRAAALTIAHTAGLGRVSREGRLQFAVLQRPLPALC